MKIQHKKSAIADAGVAKRPTAAATEYGELCINYNHEDPSLFIRVNDKGNDTDSIVKVGGDLDLYLLKADLGATVILGETPPVFKPNGDQIAAGDLWYCSSTEVEGGGRLYVYYVDDDTSQWVDTSLPGTGANFGQTEAEGLFLSKVSDDTAAGAITFEGTTTHEAGVKVTGGTAATASLFSTSDADINLANALGNILFKAHNSSNSSTGFALSAINSNTIPDVGCNLRHQTNQVLNTGLRSSLKASSVNTEVRNYDAHSTADSDFSNVTLYTQFNGRLTSTPALSAGSDQYVFKVNNFDGLGDSQSATGANNYAFYCAVNPNNDSNKSNWSYYAAGTARSYFGGLTQHVRGIRITGLAESGSQLFITTGDAPSYTSVGAHFKGNIKNGDLIPQFNGGFLSDVASHNATNTVNAFCGRVNADTTNTNNPNLVGYNFYDFRDLDQFGTDGYDGDVTAFLVSPEITLNNPVIKDGKIMSGFRSEISNTIANAYNIYIPGSAPNFIRGEAKIQGNTSGYFNVAPNQAAGPTLEIVRSNAAGPSQNAIEVWANNKADAADLQWKVSWTGVASFSAIEGALADVQVQMNADDPAAFTTTFALEEDEEGNEVQVENTTYTGTTESLLEIIRDLRAAKADLEGRLAAIESNEVVDDATDTVLLTTVADLVERVAALEGA